ncbi:MAG: tripartite tricarboxylate transporter substrate-binding protein [Xanthobacteraceae bacterium]
MAGPMGRSLGVNVVVENVTGAAGSVGVGRVAHSAPDGYTLSIGHWSTHVVNGATYKPSYDLLRDFSPISMRTPETTDDFIQDLRQRVIGQPEITLMAITHTKARSAMRSAEACPTALSARPTA